MSKVDEALVESLIQAAGDAAVLSYRYVHCNGRGAVAIESESAHKHVRRIKEALMERLAASSTPPAPKTICNKPTEGHSKGMCSLPSGHQNYCWFPNMYNDM